MNTLVSTEPIRNSLTQLIETPNMRPYVFRTRFERNMVRISSYAKETQHPALYNLAQDCLKKSKVYLFSSVIAV